MDPVVTERLGVDHPLTCHIAAFLTDLSNANANANANASPRTICAYRSHLSGFAGHHDAEIGELSAVPARAYLAEIAGSPTWWYAS